MSSNHEHHWIIESSHVTSEGTVAYQRCDCGARRVVRAALEPIATR